jgi:multiple sugar transport system permease protein
MAAVKPIESGPRTLISPAQLSRGRGRVIYWIVLGVMIPLFAALFLFPLYWMVTGGLKSPSQVVQTPPTLVPSHPEFHNYLTAWNDLGLGRLILNTVVYAGGALVFQVAFDVAAAYAISKLRPALGNVILFAMLAAMMIPATVLVLPQYLTANSLPLLHTSILNTPWVIWLPSVANGFNIFILKRFFDSVPAELLAAAALDGAGPFRTLWRVVLPISRPIIGVVSIFAAVNVWKDFLWPLLVLSEPSAQTINIGLYHLNYGIPEDVFIAALAIACVPTIVFFLIFQRNIMAGLTAGGVKG